MPYTQPINLYIEEYMPDSNLNDEQIELLKYQKYVCLKPSTKTYSAETTDQGFTAAAAACI